MRVRASRVSVRARLCARARRGWRLCAGCCSSVVPSCPADEWLGAQNPDRGGRGPSTLNEPNGLLRGSESEK
eukprot:10218927-Alexandrium_andersonii.AAC.1